MDGELYQPTMAEMTSDEPEFGMEDTHIHEQCPNCEANDSDHDVMCDSCNEAYDVDGSEVYGGIAAAASSSETEIF